MSNVHDQARKFLSQEKAGLHLRDTQKKAVFLFADWLLANGLMIQSRKTKHSPYELIQCYCQCEKCREARGEIRR